MGANVLLEETKIQSMKFVMPVLSKKCTILLISNLMEPQWVSVSCSEKLLPHVICSQRPQLQTRPQMPSQRPICPFPMMIAWRRQYERNCMFFVWHKMQNNTGKRHRLQTICGAGIPPKIVKMFQPKFTEYQTHKYDTRGQVFEVGGRIGNTPFRVFNFCGMKKLEVVCYEVREKSYEWWNDVRSELHRFTWNNMSIPRNDTVERFLCFVEPLEFVNVSRYVMYARTKEQKGSTGKHFISTKFICEGESFQKFWQLVYMQESVQCNCSKLYKYSALFYQTAQNKCLSYSHHDKNGTKQSAPKFTCNDGKDISEELLDDLVPDCSLGEDEQIYKNILAKTALPAFSCLDPNHLPCAAGHPHCYHMRDICVYILDDFNHLYPCRVGSHLHNCIPRETPGYFACREYYIPWSYVHDGKWDCPSGKDEFVEGITPTQCNHSLKCNTHKAKCVDMLHICDDHFDCPEGEDEYLCDVQTHQICPTSCFCVNLAIHCVNYTAHSLGSWYKYFLSYHIVSSQLQFLETMINLHVKIINVTQNQVKLACFGWGKKHRVHMIDFSFNKISNLKEKCFSHLAHLSIINLNNNNISEIRCQTFHSLRNLTVLNLSQANISQIHKNAFYNITNFSLLYLLQNPLIDLHVQIFFETVVLHIFTDSFQLCCLKPVGAECSADMPWDISCFTLFPSVPIRVCFITFASCILVLNLVCLSTNVYRAYNISKSRQFENRQKSSAAFNFIVLFVNIGDLLCGIYLALVCYGDALYGKEFLLKDLEWKKSFVCIFGFSIMFLFIFCTPFIITFMTLARLMVVKYPFDSKFKSTKFVIICLICVMGTALAVTVSVIVPYMVHHVIPNVLCMPFVDSRKSLIETSVLTVLSVVVQTAAVLTIMIKNILIVQAVKKSKKQSHSGAVSPKLIA